MEDLSYKDKKFNFKRKLWHVLGLIVPILLYMDVFRFIDPNDLQITRKIGLILIFIFLFLLLLIEILRLNIPYLNKFFIQNFGFLMKKNEYHKIHGAISYIYAIYILFIFFTKEVIFISLLVLMICDPIAAYVGIYYGKRKLANQKTLEGAVAFAISSMLIIILFFLLLSFINNGESDNYFFNIKNFPILLIIVIFTSIITSIVETISISALEGFIDDNLTIPISVSISFSVLSLLLDIPIQYYYLPLI